ncbi:MAG TPA: Gfo/Idh/MocA family oxidoreductase, partial [Candidatus Dormibacteraeota bacterium]|nr:Gfo/Idh/MocA family oxidoreductase [Candidatus Dormibacteraeota bacterium]
MEGSIRIALVGAGMFGGDVHARAYADLQRAGIAPQLGRVGLDSWARDFAGIKFELVAVATRSEKSALRAQGTYHSWSGQQPRTYWGEKPWKNVLQDFPGLDVLAVATPDNLHTEVILS